MQRKYRILTFFFISIIVCLVLSSCGEIMHAYNSHIIESVYLDCLASAQTASDSADCMATHERRVEEENIRHQQIEEGRQPEIDNIKKCISFTESVLRQWGYNNKEIKNVTKGLRTKKTETRLEIRNQYSTSFDCDEIIMELLKEYYDMNGMWVFERKLPEFGLPSSDAAKALQLYYEYGLYKDDREYSDDERILEKDPVYYCNRHDHFGNDIKVTKELLVNMGLLDDGVEDKGKEETNQSQNTMSEPVLDISDNVVENEELDLNETDSREGSYDDGVFKSIVNNEANNAIETLQKTNQSAVKVQPVIVQSNNRIEFGYATYLGDDQNGKPHGNGSLIFKRKHKIPGTNVYAYPDEVVTGTWREGKINMGTLYRSNGEAILVKIGQNVY